MKSLLGLLSLLLASSCLPAQANHWKGWQNADYIQKAFIEIALKNEYRKTQLKVTKWDTPIRYEFVYESLQPSALVEKLTHIHFKHLQKITQHPIFYSGKTLGHFNPSDTVKYRPKQRSNFRIILTRDSHFSDVIAKHIGEQSRSLAMQSNCIANYRVGKNNQITSALIIIPIDHAMSKGKLPACVVEEITQAMGLPNDSDWVNPSIANDKSEYDLLTGLDYVLLKLLYNKKLKSGMPLNQSRPILKNILTSMSNNKAFSKASSKVNRSGLNRFFN